MRRIALVSLLALFVAACASRGATKHVKAAIKASGGAEKLRTVDNYHFATDGDWLGEPYTGVSHDERDGSWRWDMKSEGMSMSAWVIGGDVYVSSGAGQPAAAQTGEQATMWKMHRFVGTSVLLPDRLLEADVKLSKADPVTLDGKQCPAIIATHNGEAVTFVFDPDNKMIRQVHFTMPDEETGEDMPATMTLSDWQVLEGIQYPGASVMTWEMRGKTYVIKEQVTEVIWNEQIPEGTLSMPEIAPPLEFNVKTMPATRMAVHTFVGPYQDVGVGIGNVMQWVTTNGGAPSGNVTLVYRELPNPEDFNKSKTVIQVPVKMTSASGDAVKTMTRPTFQFAYTTYTGHASGCHMVFSPVLKWCKENGYEKTGPMRVAYVEMDEQTMQCTAEVGFPVKKAAAAGGCGCGE